MCINLEDQLYFQLETSSEVGEGWGDAMGHWDRAPQPTSYSLAWSMDGGRCGHRVQAEKAPRCVLCSMFLVL